MPLSPDDKIKYKQLYLQTAKEYVSALQNTCAQLEAGKQTAENLEVLHRSSHSLKSQSKMMEYNQIGDLSEALEHFFAPYAESGEKISSEEIAHIKDAVEQLSSSLSSLEKNDEEISLIDATKMIKKQTMPLS